MNITGHKDTLEQSLLADVEHAPLENPLREKANEVIEKRMPERSIGSNLVAKVSEGALGSSLRRADANVDRASLDHVGVDLASTIVKDVDAFCEL